MSIVVLKEDQPKHIAAGQAGFFEVHGIAQFSTTDLTGTIPCKFGHVSNMQITPIGGGSFVKVREFSSIGSLSATGAINIIVPGAGSISQVLFITATSVTANDTNFWTFGLVDKTGTLTPVDSTVAANTTKATGGASITGYTAVSLTLNVLPAQLIVSANDVLEFTATKNSAATTMAECGLIVIVQSAQQEPEVVMCDDAAQVTDNMIVRETGGTLTFTRQTRGTPTSGLIFTYRYIGRA